MDLITIREKLEKAWSAETSYWPSLWSLGEDKATGQCAVTALAVHALMGGEIMSGIVQYGNTRIKARHYWNKINGLDIDLTWRQFPAGSKLSEIKQTTEKQLRKSKELTDRYFKLFNKANGF